MNKIYIHADSLVHHRVNDVLIDPQYVDPHYTSTLAKDLVGTTAFVFDGTEYIEFSFSDPDKDVLMYNLEIHQYEYHFKDKERCVGYGGCNVSIAEGSAILSDWMSPTSITEVGEGFRLKPYSMFRLHKLSSIDLGTIVIPYVYDVINGDFAPVIQVTQKSSSGKFIFKLNSIFLVSEDIG